MEPISTIRPRLRAAIRSANQVGADDRGGEIHPDHAFRRRDILHDLVARQAATETGIEDGEVDRMTRIRSVERLHECSETGQIETGGVDRRAARAARGGRLREAFRIPPPQNSACCPGPRSDGRALPRSRWKRLLSRSF